LSSGFGRDKELSYRRHKGSVVLIKHHLVWMARCRRRVLVGPVAVRLEQLLHEKAGELNVTIEQFALQPDHLHLFVFVSAPPAWAVSQVVFRRKGYTSRALRQEFPQLLKKLSERWHACPFCGFSCHRDENAAQNIRKKGGGTAFGEPVALAENREPHRFSSCECQLSLPFLSWQGDAGRRWA
jgi:putative transposase